jgi:hypothetical protein
VGALELSEWISTVVGHYGFTLLSGETIASERGVVEGRADQLDEPLGLAFGERVDVR